MGRAFVTFSLLLLATLVLAPVGTMVVESFLADYVVLERGERLVGQIRNSDEKGVTFRIHGATGSEYYERSEVAREGRTLSLVNYSGVLRGPGERNMLVATVALAGAATLLALFLGLPLGLLLGATDLPFRRAFETLAILPLVLPPVLLAIATYYDLVNLKPEFFRAVVVFGLSLFPLVSLFTARAVRATGADALDAARLQTTPKEALFRVVLAPAIPGAAAGALLVFAFVVSDFAVPDFLGVTTAKNTITVYANAVFQYWNESDAGAATAAGMPATLLAVIALALVLRVEARRTAATVAGGFREPEPLALGRWRVPALVAVALLLLIALVWPAYRHLETAGGKHFGQAVGLQAPSEDDPRGKPASVLDGMRKGIQQERVGESLANSLTFGAGGALLAVLLALLLTEAGRGRPHLDRFLLVAAFLPVAVPPMAFAVGWVRLFGPAFADMRFTPVLLLAARLLPFATFAVRATRARIGESLQDAASVAGLGPGARFARITLPLVLPGAALGFLLAFLFGLREVDALVFTSRGAETMPVLLYNNIHYGYDVQVAALSFLWMAGVGLLLLALGLLLGRRFRLVP
ncbi:MAG: ABC transporter permease [Planctomycetota bacterium]